MIILSTLANIGVEIRAFITFLLIELNSMFNLVDTGIPESFIFRAIISILISLLFSLVPQSEETYKPKSVEQEPTEMIPTMKGGFDELILSSEGISKVIHKEDP